MQALPGRARRAATSTASSFHRHQIRRDVVNVFVAVNPQQRSMLLQGLVDVHDRHFAFTAERSRRAVGLHDRDRELVEADEASLVFLTLRQRDGGRRRLQSRRGGRCAAPAAVAARQQPPLLECSRIGKARVEPAQIPGQRVTRGARLLEVRLARGRVARDDGLRPYPRRIAAVDVEAVKKRGNVGDLLAREVEFRHRRWPAGRQHRRDQLTASVVLHELRTQQARAGVASACVGAVAELAVDGVDGFPALEHVRVGGGTFRKSGLCGAAPALAGRLLRGCGQHGGRDCSRRPSQHLLHQNKTLAANCICRGMLLPVVVTLPKPAVPSAALGFPKLGVLNTLNTSARSCSWTYPLNGTFLNNDKSIRLYDGPCNVLLPVLPAVLIVSATKALTSNHCAIVGLASSGLLT